MTNSIIKIGQHGYFRIRGRCGVSAQFYNLLPRDNLQVKPRIWSRVRRLPAQLRSSLWRAALIPSEIIPGAW
ncbi:hypothetical protein LCGC14_0916510 [marine sediment metagenome]|uniref:Uncharacterized protein n=1 Tax=marine sediment metagenome TaxID=412755 RepID=A0A0F9RAW8_9ZZZZ